MEGLHERLTEAARGRTYRALSDLTGIHPETVRRYMQGQAPSVEFVVAMCQALEINAHWLMTGDGPMRAEDMRRHALQEADAGELLGAVAGALETLTERVRRVEVYVQTLETRMRSSAGLPECQEPGTRGYRKRGKGRTKPPGEKIKGESDGDVPTRPGRVADAVSERSRSDAD